MAYQSLLGRDTDPWIRHFNQQADGTLKRDEKDGLILIKEPTHATSDPHQIPIQNVAPVEQSVAQAAMQIKEEKKKSYKKTKISQQDSDT